MFLGSMESVSLWWPCCYSNNNNFKFINFYLNSLLSSHNQPGDMCLMFPEGQPNFKEEPDVNIKNHSLLKEDKDSLFLSQIWMSTAQKQSSLKWHAPV